MRRAGWMVMGAVGAWCWVAAGVGLRGAEGIARTFLLVLAKTDHTLAVVDPQTLQVLFRVRSGPDPHEVVASEDGRFAYVSNYGGGAYNTITVVDLAGKRNLPPIDLGALRGPHGLKWADGKLWFTAEAAKAIGSWDPATRTVDWVLGTGQDRTHMIFVAPDGQHMVTSNVSSATMTMIEKDLRPRGPGGPPPPSGPLGPSGGGANRASGPGPGPGPGGPPQGDWEETVVPVGRGAEGFDVSPDRREIWAANAQDGTISVIDVATKKVTDTLRPGVESANRLKFTPDGRHVLVSMLRGADVVVLDAKSRSVVKRIAVGSGAAGIQMEPSGARAFVACTPDSWVVVIDLQTMTVTGKIDAGRQPDGLAWVVEK